MASPTAALSTLTIEGRLALVDPQWHPITIEAFGRHAAVEFPDIVSAHAAYAAINGRDTRNHALRLLQEGLRAADLELDFRVRGVSVARLAGDSRPTLPARVLGLGAVELHLGKLLRSLLPP